MASPRSPRALRLGVLLGGNLVEERVIPGRSPVTIGQSLRCTLSIPADGVPHEHTLFAFDQGRLLLRAAPGMTGRIAHGDTVSTEIPATTPVTRGMRGKLQIGDATVLFQEIAAPPLAPRPVLPASIRGTLLGRVDKRLAVIIGGSLAVHLFIGAWAWATETETRDLFTSDTVAQYRHETMEVTLPDLSTPTTTTTPDPGPGAATPVSPVQTPRPIVDRPRITTTVQPTPGMTPDEAARLASILTGSDPGRTGPGEMSNRQPGAELRQQIDDVGNRTVTIGDDNKGFREQPGPRLGTDPGPIVKDQTTGTTSTPKLDAEVKGRITLRPLPPQGPGTTLTADMIVDKINTVYMPQLQRCYRKGLLGDATLAGKIDLSFTVTERGGLADIRARGVSSEVDGCISSAMGAWRFAIPRDEDGDATDQGFRLALALTPS